MTLLNKKSIQFKIALINVLGLIPTLLLMFGYVFPLFDAKFMEQKKVATQSAVELGLGTIQSYQESAGADPAAQKDAQERAKQAISKMRYAGGEYFSLFNEKYLMLAHPKKEMVNQDVSGLTDPDGIKIVVKQVEVATQQGGGFLNFKFPKPGSDQPIRKVAYAAYFKPWGWIISSGVYLDDVDRESHAFKVKVTSGVLFVFFLSCVIGVLFARTLSRKLSEITRRVDEGAVQLNDAAVRISNLSESLSSSTKKEADAVQETTVSLEEISAMVSKNADNTKSLSKLSSETREISFQGKSDVQAAIEAIGDIARGHTQIVQEVRDSNEEVSNIIKVIKEIESKTKIIHEIVFQTRLLAFNASVEAARAGEHGKGFAVVSEEVGVLAQNSGKAAQEISQILVDSTNQVQKIVSNSEQRVQRIVESGKQSIEKGTVVVQRCVETLDRIVKTVEQVNGMAGEIDNASREQSGGVQEISKSMQSIDTVTAANTETSKSTAQAAESLLNQAQTLRVAVVDLARTVQGERDGGEGRKAA